MLQVTPRACVNPEEAQIRAQQCERNRDGFPRERILNGYHILGGGDQQAHHHNCAKNGPWRARACTHGDPERNFSQYGGLGVFFFLFLLGFF